jgi:alpha-amylase
MGVVLHAAYRRIIKSNARTGHVSVPSPIDPKSPKIDWWYDHLAKQANEFAKAGFTALLLPPVCKTNAGAFPGADGYGVYDDYDIGNKDQFFSIPTRFGNREQLQRLCAVLHANGIDVYADMVPHQRNGGRSGVYQYRSATGKKNGRFPKHPSCFFGPANQGRVPRDPIAGPVSDDQGFGDELCTLNSTPKNYVLNGLIDAGDWLTQTLDLKGYRIDDTKGQVSASVLKWANSKSMAGKIAIGEFFDGNPNTLNWWVWESGINGRVYAFDFALHFVLQKMCNNADNFDMQQLDHAGFAGISPEKAVTFVENPDTDLSDSRVVWNKLLAYAYILTSEGYPVIFYKDYSNDAGCYGLKHEIDNLVWIHENLANGETVYRWKDPRFVVYERTGFPNLLVGLNNDRFKGWKTVTVQTGFGANTHLHDYTGHAGDVWTDSQGKVTIGIPPNNNGQGYICYSRAAQNSNNSSKNKLPTTQCFFGAEDLDIGPATNTLKAIGRIWCEGNTFIRVNVDKNIVYKVQNPTGKDIEFANDIAQSQERGWHTINVKSATPPQAFSLKVTYQASLIIN